MRNLIEQHSLTLNKRKEQIKSLEKLKVDLKLVKETIYLDPTLLFSSSLHMIEREQRMIVYFCYEITPVPTSLFEDGMMRKSAKSVLMKTVIKNVPKERILCISSIYFGWWSIPTQN